MRRSTCALVATSPSSNNSSSFECRVKLPETRHRDHHYLEAIAAGLVVDNEPGLLPDCC